MGGRKVSVIAKERSFNKESTSPAPALGNRGLSRDAMNLLEKS